MKPITDKNKLPKFLKLNSEIKRDRSNTHIPMPFKVGELVKVEPFEEQTTDILMFKENFSQRFCKVRRKDAEGKWTLVYTIEWKYLQTL